MMKNLYAGFRFLFELVTLFCLGYGGFHLGQLDVLRFILCITLPLIAIVVWGMWGSPKAPKRLTNPLSRFALEVTLYGVATFCIIAIGQIGPGIAYGLIGLTNCVIHQLWQPDV